MKRIIMLVLALSMIFALCACDNGGVKPTETPSTPAGTTTATPVKFGLDRTTYVMFTREKLQLTPTVSEGTTWKSSNEAAATVKDGGVVTAIAKGEVKITATSAKGEVAECTIRVVDASDFYTPADITKLVLKKSEIDKAVQDELKYMCEYFSELKPADREAKDGDTVRATYIGTLKGETAPFDGGTGTNDIEIGSGTFIEGFESGLIGTKKGDTVTLNLKFPESYVDPEKDAASAEKLNGKEVTFVVTIHDVLESKPAELTDELVTKATNSQYKTVADYTKYVEDSLRDYLKIELAINSGEVKKYDDEMIEIYEDIYLQNMYGTYASMYGMSIEAFAEMYYGLSAEELAKEANESAKGYLEQLYMCYTLNLTPTEKERTDLLKTYLTSIGYTKTIEEYTAEYGESFVDNYVLTEFALSYVRNTITIDTAN